MINITKVQGEPQPLQDFKANTQLLGAGSPCNYDLLVNPQKNDYKLALLIEQHYLCAYCNRILDEYIEPTEKLANRLHLLKIEHWYPQSLCQQEASFNTLNGRDVSHENMLIVCPGENANPKFTHCDSSRTDGSTLTIKPQDPAFRFSNVFRYEGGALITDIAAIQTDVSDELNLNDDMLIHRRNVVLNQFIKSLPNKNAINKQVLIQKYTTPNRENRLKEYCTLIVYFIVNNLN